MDAVTFIQQTTSEVLVKQHLKLVFETYQSLFGEVCTNCPAKISGYIKRIKKHGRKNAGIGQTLTCSFLLKERSIIMKPGSNEVYSNANLTDEVAIAFLRKNPNRKVLFSKLPNHLETLLKEKKDNDPRTKDDLVLEDYTMTELRALFPEAKGRSKKDLIASIALLQDSYIENI
ncbi:hypothetical protein [Neptunitalea lumnitzerae]|uniref:Rho termination factor N-terminal domain-containing protein n=1 Tax=Neptunitalea lumnitzerae TaxID=2965509 RepID=A0ABQ5MEF1_9FLAO|nr:hypothetical protein [Neptunitalea sp. Y10]GLB47754.1 hypothetical protein Y10_01220 [Neptunitalea sp. Y10]